MRVIGFYSHVKSDIILKTQGPSVNQAYVTAIQEERQRNLGITNTRKRAFNNLGRKK